MPAGLFPLAQAPDHVWAWLTVTHLSIHPAHNVMHITCWMVYPRTGRRPQLEQGPTSPREALKYRSTLLSHKPQVTLWGLLNLDPGSRFPSVCPFLLKSAQACPILCGPMDYRLLGYYLHGIFQARTLEWGAISYSSRSFLLRGQTCVSCMS